MPYKDPVKNKEAKQKSHRKHFLKNQARLAVLYRANKNKFKQRSQQWRTANHEKMLATLRKYRHDNPEYTMWVAAKHRAKKKNLAFTLEVKDIVIPKFCPVLGLKLQIGDKGWTAGSPSLDRIVGALGYVKDNVRVISWRANQLKRDGTAEEFERLAAYLRGEI